MNEGCIFFQKQDFRKALSLFKSAITLLTQLNEQEDASEMTFGTELFYNLALTYFEIQEYQNAIEFLDRIMAKAYETYP